MDPDAPADRGKPDGQQTQGSDAEETVHGGIDQVLVLSPGVTLTLGKDALLLSGRSSWSMDSVR